MRRSDGHIWRLLVQTYASQGFSSDDRDLALGKQKRVLWPRW